MTVAMHLDSIDYDSKNQEYEIQLSKVKLIHLDIKNDIIRLKVPFHRLQRIKTPTYNAELYTTVSNKAPNHHKTPKSPKTPSSDISHKSDEDIIANDPNLDEIMMITKDNVDDDDKDEEDYKSDQHEQQVLNDDEKRENEIITPKRPKNMDKNIDIKPLKKSLVIKEWNEICKKHPISNTSLDPNSTQIPIITKEGCFARVVFILKTYTRWISYKDKHFKSESLPKVKTYTQYIQYISIDRKIAICMILYC